MISPKLTGAAGALSLIVTVFATGPAVAQEAETIDVPGLSCKQVMALSGVDRDTTISFLHGYLTAKRGDTTIDIDRLTDASEAFVDACLDAPKDSALAMLEKQIAAMK